MTNMKQKVPLSEGLATRVKTTKNTVSKNLSEEKKEETGSKRAEKISI